MIGMVEIAGEKFFYFFLSSAVCYVIAYHSTADKKNYMYNGLNGCIRAGVYAGSGALEGSNFSTILKTLTLTAFFLAISITNRYLIDHIYKRFDIADIERFIYMSDQGMIEVMRMDVNEIVSTIGFDGFEGRVISAVEELLNNVVKENDNWVVYEVTVSGKTANVIRYRFKRFKAVLAKVFGKPFKAEINGKTIRVVVKK